MRTIRSFEDLDVWKVGRELRKELYSVADRLPEKESYNLAAQIRSAAISLTANIAEGYGRFHFKENIRFCRMSRGLAYELLDHLTTCKDQGYLKEKDYQDLYAGLSRFSQLPNGYIRSIGKASLSEGALSSDE